MKTLSALSLSGILIALPLPAIASASHASVLEPAQAKELIRVQDVTAHDGKTSGVLVNSGSTPVQDVKLIVQYHYRWANEFKPGNHSPGVAHEFTIAGTIPPGGREPFSVASVPPAAPEHGGHFVTDVKVLAFDQLEPAQVAQSNQRA